MNPKVNDMALKKIILGSLLASCGLVASVAVRPASHLWQAHLRDKQSTTAASPRLANDISGLNPTRMHTIAVETDSAAALLQLRQLIELARTKSLSVAIAGSQHSMGGHTLAPGGIRLDMRPFKHMRLDTATNLLTVGAGATWADVIPYLNRYGRAVATMQSDNAFTVGGSLSVNCHGWQPNQPPIAATVQSVLVLLADGQLLRCSRQQNQELFALVLGGYGLFGIILEAQLQTHANKVYRYQRVKMDAGHYLQEYQRHIDANPQVHLAYGRLNVTPTNFLEEATLNYFTTQRAAPPQYPLPEPGLTAFKRAVFLGSKHNEYGKQLRWDLEQSFSQTQVGNEYSRNEIMNESPAFYLNRTAGQTDVLHEYFIPAQQYNAFRLALQRRIPQHKADLLNVTLRNVYADTDTFLPYAREEVFGFVLFFNQGTTAADEADMVALTQELIADAEHLGGTYYLPYRLHAEPAQLARVYPQFQKFVALKQRYDPKEVFQNKFYQQYRIISEPQASPSRDEIALGKK
ncbi:FAD-binding protein [Hymenobacter arizonensis]|uniref:FAD/FMN-containing dehydrogenase n=1 Tax=Hymenobacter arizonensis TaxID=1227077 RepID=A0A1I5U564_HYMAR|nr:FAD-binding oxidoreductase [Hymenobacter arizonensis]SFP90409.1 FAD/FMN-containing dehydrogenase [Hymenobacter arizonensis]